MLFLCPVHHLLKAQLSETRCRHQLLIWDWQELTGIADESIQDQALVFMMNYTAAFKEMVLS